LDGSVDSPTKKDALPQVIIDAMINKNAVRPIKLNLRLKYFIILKLLCIA
jgi:hypothetical protein